MSETFYMESNNDLKVNLNSLAYNALIGKSENKKEANVI